MTTTPQTIAQFYERYSCKLRYDSLQEYFHLYVAMGHPRDEAYRYARTYWQHRRPDASAVN